MSSRWPAAAPASKPLYCHELRTYRQLSASNPLNRPSRSSVSRKSSETIAIAFVYAHTYSRKYRSFVIT